MSDRPSLISEAVLFGREEGLRHDADTRRDNGQPTDLEIVLDAAATGAAYLDEIDYPVEAEIVRGAMERVAQRVEPADIPTYKQDSSGFQRALKTCERDGNHATTTGLASGGGFQCDDYRAGHIGFKPSTDQGGNQHIVLLDATIVTHDGLRIVLERFEDGHLTGIINGVAEKVREQREASV